MAHDNSMASRMEAWIVEQLAACEELAAERVEHWRGSSAVSGKMIEELVAKASATEPYVAVTFDSDRPFALQEGAQAHKARYSIYVVVTNQREGAARTGDGTMMGTNGLRDVIRMALHNQRPGIGAGGYWTDDTEYMGIEPIVERADAFIMRAELLVQESPVCGGQSE